MCVCVTDVGVAATNLRFVCKTIIFLEIVKAAVGLDTMGSNDLVQTNRQKMTYRQNDYTLPLAAHGAIKYMVK